MEPDWSLFFPFALVRIHLVLPWLSGQLTLIKTPDSKSGGLNFRICTAEEDPLDFPSASSGIPKEVF